MPTFEQILIELSARNDTESAFSAVDRGMTGIGASAAKLEAAFAQSERASQAAGDAFVRLTDAATRLDIAQKLVTTSGDRAAASQRNAFTAYRDVEQSMRAYETATTNAARAQDRLNSAAAHFRAAPSGGVGGSAVQETPAATGKKGEFSPYGWLYSPEGLATLGLVAGGARAAGVALNVDTTQRNAVAQTTADPATLKILQDLVTQLASQPGDRFTQSQISQAAYAPLSTGFTSKADLGTILDVGLKGATGAGVDPATEVAAITTALHAYALSAKDAGQVADIFNQTVAVGAAQAKDTIAAIGVYSASTAAVGIQFKDAEAVFAQLTLNGVTPGEAAQQVNALGQSLAKPDVTAAQALRIAGVPFGQQKVTAAGLPAILDQIQAVTGGDPAQIAKLFPNQAARDLVLGVTGKNYESYRTTRGLVDQYSGAVERSNAIAGSGPQAQLDQLAVKFTTDVKNVGDSLLTLLPAVANVASHLDTLAGQIGTAGGLIGSALDDLVAKIKAGDAGTYLAQADRVLDAVANPLGPDFGNLDRARQDVGQQIWNEQHPKEVAAAAAAAKAAALANGTATPATTDPALAGGQLEQVHNPRGGFEWQWVPNTGDYAPRTLDAGSYAHSAVLAQQAQQAQVADEYAANPPNPLGHNIWMAQQRARPSAPIGPSAAPGEAISAEDARLARQEEAASAAASAAADQQHAATLAAQRAGLGAYGNPKTPRKAGRTETEQDLRDTLSTDILQGASATKLFGDEAAIKKVIDASIKSGAYTREYGTLLEAQLAAQLDQNLASRHTLASQQALATAGRAVQLDTLNLADAQRSGNLPAQLAAIDQKKRDELAQATLADKGDSGALGYERKRITTDAAHAAEDARAADARRVGGDNLQAAQLQLQASQQGANNAQQQITAAQLVYVAQLQANKAITDPAARANADKAAGLTRDTTEKGILTGAASVQVQAAQLQLQAAQQGYTNTQQQLAAAQALYQATVASDKNITDPAARKNADTAAGLTRDATDRAALTADAQRRISQLQAERQYDLNNGIGLADINKRLATERAGDAGLLHSSKYDLANAAFADQQAAIPKAAPTFAAYPSGDPGLSAGRGGGLFRFGQFSADSEAQTIAMLRLQVERLEQALAEAQKQTGVQQHIELNTRPSTNSSPRPKRGGRY